MPLLQTPRPVRVWDAPTRLFHWALALLVAFSFISAKQAWMEWHFLSGKAVLTLVLFRILWGVLGSDSARFARFLASPAAALRHLRHLGRREPDREPGHNAAGGWMVLGLLLLLAVQISTGLFANDDGINEGPYAGWAGKDLSDRITVWHIRNFNLIALAVLLHVLAIAAYRLLKGQNLAAAMITGRKALPPSVAAPRMVSSWRALLLLAVSVAAAGWIAAGF